MIRVLCACGRAFKTDDRNAGKRTKCPECGAELTIGPVPKPSSSGGDVDGAPAWWYPGETSAGAPRGTPPTRSGSDPGSDAVSTMVLPGGYDPKTSSQPSSQPPSTAAPGKAQPSGPKE